MQIVSYVKVFCFCLYRGRAVKNIAKICYINENRPLKIRDLFNINMLRTTPRKRRASSST